MKNVMKKLLLLVCLIGFANNLVAMHQTAGAPAKKVVAVETKRVVAQGSTPLGTSIAAFKNPYDNLLVLCEQGDLNDIKAALKKTRFRQSEIVNASITIKHDRIKRFLLVVNNLFYVTHADVPKAFETIKTNTKKYLDKFALLVFIPHILDLAIFFEKADLVKHLIQNYAENNDVIMRLIQTIFQEAALAGKADMVECLLDSTAMTGIIDDKLLESVASQVTAQFKTSNSQALQSVTEKFDMEVEVRKGMRFGEDADAENVEDDSDIVEALAAATSALTLTVPADQKAYIPTDGSSAQIISQKN